MTDPTPAGNGGGGLLPAHLDDLARSGLTAAHAADAGLYSEPDPAAVARLLGWKYPARDLGPCLVFPYHDPDGRPSGYARLKPSTPRADKRTPGKVVKYEAPVGVPNRAYLPPGTRAVLADPAVGLLVTEGEKKALAADAAGAPCVGLSGVWAWQKKRPRDANGKGTGPRELIPDLAAVPWAGRSVAVAFDSDAADNPLVRAAERALVKALAAAGAVARAVRLPAGPGGAKQGLDDFLVAHGPAALADLLAAPPPADGPADPGRKEKPDKPPAVADRLADLGRELDLWHDDRQVGYATLGRRTLAVRSRAFRLYLIDRLRREGDGKVPNAEAVAAAVNSVEAEAVFDGPERPAHVRAAGCGGRVYLHLADPADTVIEVDAGGWRVCDDPPVRFRRPAGMLALPMPAAGGAVADLRPLLNLADDDAFTLVLAWLASALRPAGPYPILLLSGEQGSAKTTTARAVKRLVDPAAAPARCEPRTEQDLMIHAGGSRVLVFDNLSRVKDWFSDALCRLATGGGFGTRTLYENDEETIFDATRPVVLTSIEDVASRADLLERCLLVRLPPIPEPARRPESAFWAGFEAAHPRLLGAVLDRVAAGLRALPGVTLDRLPRMADFALFAAACERGAGEPPRVLAAYADNQRAAHEQALDASPVAAAVVAFMAGRGGWAGPPAGLLGELAAHTACPPPHGWPKQPNALTNKLRRLAPDLRRVHGLDVDCDGRASGGRSAGKRDRRVGIARLNPPGVPPSPPSPARADAGDGGDGRTTAAGRAGLFEDQSLPD